MSFQAYLDAIEVRTGLTSRQLVEQAKERGLYGPGTEAGEIVTWLKEEHDLGRGHAMALVHVIRNGATIDDRHVGSDGTHRDESTELWLDGKATKPGPAAS